MQILNGSYAPLIPLAKPQTSNNKESEKQKDERKNGEVAAQGKEQCHSKHKLSVQSRKKPFV